MIDILIGVYVTLALICMIFAYFFEMLGGKRKTFIQVALVSFFDGIFLIPIFYLLKIFIKK